MKQMTMVVLTACTLCPLAALAQTAAPQPVPTPVPGVGGIITRYDESFFYSAATRRSFVPAYTPHISSQFENPRDYPYALGTIATPYHFWAGCYGWFFSSPNGPQTSIPEGSQVLAYHRGELGITSQLAKGYPSGQRVVEAVLVPVPMASQKGGFLIDAGKKTLTVTDVTPTPVSVQPYYTPTPVPPQSNAQSDQSPAAK